MESCLSYLCAKWLPMMVRLDAILGWIQTHHELMSWMAVISVSTFLVTLLAVPILIIHIPEKHFLYKQRTARHNPNDAVGFRLICRILKNIAGLFFVLIGMIMLLTPGQGLLSILVGVMLMDLPGKYRVERAIIRKEKVLSTINWLRAKAHRPPLQVENAE
jgi:uncharacterized membrane protein